MILVEFGNSLHQLVQKEVCAYYRFSLEFSDLAIQSYLINEV